MKVVIDGKLELNLPAPPRQGEIVSWNGDARRVAEVVWVIPATNMYGQAPSAEDVAVHIQLERDWREGKTDAELHAAFSHPDFDYATTEGARKQFDASVPPADDNGDPDPTWERNAEAGRDGWERFEYTEEAYWRRPKQKPTSPKLDLDAFHKAVDDQDAMIFENSAYTEYHVAVPCPQCQATTDRVEQEQGGLYRMKPCGHEVRGNARQIVVDDNGYLRAQEDPQA